MEKSTLRYTGNGNELAFLMFKNLFLTIITLGVYAAWGRTNTRRYIWGQTSYLGDRATYTGQGRELFIGWIILIALYTVLYVAINVLGKFVSPAFLLLVFPLYLYLYALVIYGGTRYRTSKTSWRGIAFGMDKDKALTRQFIGLVFKGSILTAITLGIYFPFFRNELRHFLTDRTRFGTAHFRYEGFGSQYAAIYYKGAILSLLTLGLYMPWFYVNLLRYRLEKTRFQDAGFKVHLQGGEFFVYTIGAFLLSSVTLGLATPWVLNWGIRMVVNSIEVEGVVDFESIQNVVSEGNAVADVASVEYDIDLAF